MLSTFLPWAVLLGYGGLVYMLVPASVRPRQFFGGTSEKGNAPSLWLLVASATISWIFAKSIANATNLAHAFGVYGGIGYSLYYGSFVTAGVTIYFLRTRGGYRSLPAFLVEKYGPLCARVFLIAISIRLFNEVWSNTKVASLYFGPEGSGEYWTAVLIITGFTLFYSWKGGLRSSLLTDSVQMVFVALLLGVVLSELGPELARSGLPSVSESTRSAGLTFCALACIQIFSYPFHDPVLTDRAFITSPGTMLKGFVISGLIGGGLIFLFGLIGLYGRHIGLPAAGDAVVAVPRSIGLSALLVFNAIMLSSAGSTLDSTFSSTAKLGARDWPNRKGPPSDDDLSRGRWIMILIALIGNAPLLTYFIGDRIGPAIIKATTISGTMVMGLAPIFLLSFISSAGRWSFHLAFWPGLLLGVGKAVDGVGGIDLFRRWMEIGSGEYALSLGLNLYGLLLCTAGYLGGALIPVVLRSFSAPDETFSR